MKYELNKVYFVREVALNNYDLAIVDEKNKDFTIKALTQKEFESLNMEYVSLYSNILFEAFIDGLKQFGFVEKQ